MRPAPVLRVTLLVLALEARATSAAESERGPARILDVLSFIERTRRDTRYLHQTRIDARRGIYRFDCSAMAGWVMGRAVPEARRTVSGRPLARDFYHAIARVRRGERLGPWLRVATAAEARPGDVVAWIRPSWFPSRNSGHVAFVVAAPTENRGPVRGQLLRIADSTRLPHEDDTRTAGKSGYGRGTLLLATDAEGAPLGYGWHGSISQPDWIIPTRIVIGRPLR